MMAEGRDEKIPKEVFLLRIRYLIHLKPNNKRLKKVLSSYQNKKDSFIITKVLTRILSSIFGDDSLLPVLSTINTEEDLKKKCSS